MIRFHMMKTEKITSSLEDYLEAIAAIIAANGHAHTKDIAERLHVKMPSVTNALQILSRLGLLHYRAHYPVELTDAGTQAADLVLRRHRTLQEFFTSILHLDKTEASDAACKIEHVIGDQVIDRFLVLCEAVNQRPDCAALRKHLRNAMK